MPRACSVCRHLQRAAIDRLLLSGTSSYARTAERFALSRSALHRHTRHIQRTVAAVAAEDPVAYGRTILAQVRGLSERALRLLDRAEAEGDLRAATGAIREARSCTELVARLNGELVERHAHLHAHQVTHVEADSPVAQLTEEERRFLR